MKIGNNKMCLIYGKNAIKSNEELETFQTLIELGSCNDKVLVWTLVSAEAVSVLMLCFCAQELQPKLPAPTPTSKPDKPHKKATNSPITWITSPIGW